EAHTSGARNSNRELDGRLIPGTIPPGRRSLIPRFAAHAATRLANHDVDCRGLILGLDDHLLPALTQVLRRVSRDRLPRLELYFRTFVPRHANGSIHRPYVERAHARARKLQGFLDRALVAQAKVPIETDQGHQSVQTRHENSCDHSANSPVA